ncbi:NDR1/HIN1-like protein 13 [Prosopis cineraria]|uniref:NDR1/HIN1-like protein 13 n=1 Tax=Prosopis cineraria TaxID=364024 RepID=UPI00240F4BEB|nr:NDR1/HIN1-like protein 13 [Prosopis cineraria]
MQGHDPIPIQNPPDPKPFSRRHTAGYYVQRVRDSLTTRVSKLICATLLIFLVVIAMITFVLWISLRPHRPKVHVHEFSVSGLNPESKFKNAQINFNLTTRNSNQNIGIYYENMNGSVYYRDHNIGSTPLLRPFYQEPKKTTVVGGLLRGATLKMSRELWAEALGDEKAKRNVAFRLDFTATIRFKISMWESKHHRMHANCDVTVGPDGSILDAFRDKRCPVYFSLK